MWNMLAKLLRHEHNHAFLIKHFGDAEVIKSWFDSTTAFHEQLHCGHGHCGGRRVCEMPNGEILAVCNDGTTSCPDLHISNNDRRLHTLSLKKIAGLIANSTNEISVSKDIQTINDNSSCIRVGHYIPRGTIRYPVFFGVDIHNGDLEGIINHVIGLDRSAVLLMPSIDNIGQPKINAIRAKGSALIGLQDLTNTDILIDTGKASEVFSSFHEGQEDPMPEVSCVLFPTPADAEWSNITILSSLMGIIRFMSLATLVTIGFLRFIISPRWAWQMAERLLLINNGIYWKALRMSEASSHGTTQKPLAYGSLPVVNGGE